jgi:SOS-response transcriptional repressor LexA
MDELQAGADMMLPRRIVGAVKNDRLFLLEADDSTPADTGVMPGDWPILRQQHIAEPGDVVAVLTGGRYVIRRMTAGAAPIILGKVISVVRRIGGAP